MDGLVERDAELAVFEEMLSRSSGGQGGAVLVSGPVACGKTAMLRAFGMRVADSGGVYVGATASHAESALPFAVLDQLVRNADLSDADGIPRMLIDRALNAAVQGRVGSTVETGSAVPDGEWKAWLWTALFHLAQDRPLVLAIDDAHQADVSSLQWLCYLVRRLRSAPILVVFNVCDRPYGVYSLIHSELLHEPHVRHLQLKLLSVDGVRSMLGTRMCPDSAERLAADCWRYSAGNPLLVRALMDDHLAGQPTSSDDGKPGKAFLRALSGCLHRCDPVMREVARAIAIMGPHTTASLLGRLISVSPSSVEHAVSALNSAGLLTNGYFSGKSVRAAVLDGMSAEQRVAWQSRAAQLLDDAQSFNDGQPFYDALSLYEGAALTRAEGRVAALAAEGHTNRQIARKLYITVSTVEQHLTRTYRKLGVRRRSYLPRSAADPEAHLRAH